MEHYSVSCSIRLPNPVLCSAADWLIQQDTDRNRALYSLQEFRINYSRLNQRHASDLNVPGLEAEAEAPLQSPNIYIDVTLPGSRLHARQKSKHTMPFSQPIRLKP